MRQNEIVATAKKIPTLSSRKLDQAVQRIVGYILKSNSSKEARARAEAEQGWKLPPGKTFVKGHYRNGNIEYDIGTKPIMIYDDEVLGALL